MNRKCNANCLVALSALLVLSPINVKANGNEWISTNGEWKYKSGDSFKVGWFEDQKCWYYADYQTALLKKGWVASGDAWYYLNPVNAIMQESRWVDGETYYIGNNGAMVTDTIVDGKEILADGSAIAWSESKSVVFSNASELVGKVIEGNLYITQQAANDLVLSDVTVKGKIVVEGGNEIALKNVKAAEVKNNKAETTINFEGTTAIDKVTVARSTSLIADGKYKGSINEIVVQSTTKTETIVGVRANEVVTTTYAPTTINEEVGKVSVKQESTVKLNANVKELVMNASAGHSKIEVAKDVIVDKATVASASTFVGEGTITKLEAKVDNIVVDTLVNEMIISESVKNPPITSDNVVVKPEDGKPSGGAGGGGAGGGGNTGGGETDKEVSVKTATITGKLKVGKTLKASANSDATGTLNYEWFVTSEPTNTSGIKIEGVESSTLVLTNNFIDKYIYVEISGSNNSKKVSDVISVPVTEIKEVLVTEFSSLKTALNDGDNAKITDKTTINIETDLEIPESSTLTLEKDSTLVLTNKLTVNGILEAHGEVKTIEILEKKTMLDSVDEAKLLSLGKGEIKTSTSSALRFNHIEQIVIKGKPLLIYKDTIIEVDGKQLTGPTTTAMVNLSSLNDQENSVAIGQFQHNGDKIVTLGVLENSRADINDGLNFLVLTYPNTEVHMDLKNKVALGGSINTPYLTKLFVTKDNEEKLIVGPNESGALLSGNKGEGSISINDEFDTEGVLEVILYGKTTINQDNGNYDVPVNITPARSGDLTLTSINVIDTATVFIYDQGMHRFGEKQLSKGIYYFDHDKCEWYINESK